MKKKEKDDLFAAHMPGVLHYHQSMLSDGVRNKFLAEAIERYVTPDTSFLDVGAGTGVWAILAAKLGAKRVVAIEIEECLIPLIYKHAQENGVANKIEIIHANSDDVKIRGKFDVIVSELFGGDALGEATIKSFINIREKFLAPNGVLIPQKLATLAVPTKISESIQDIPANLPVTTNFLKSIKLNYAQNFNLTERPRIKFLGEPSVLNEADFRDVNITPSRTGMKASWQMDNLNEANAITVFSQSTFTDDLVMNSFNSRSWGATVYEFKPFDIEQGELMFTLTLENENTNWSISAKADSELAPQSYSPVFSFARVRMTQQMTPHRKFKPPKSKETTSRKSR